MKKFLLILLVLTTCIVTCSCGKTLEGKLLTHKIAGETCTAYFNDGTLNLRIGSSNQTLTYELDGDDTIIINGISSYTYDIDGKEVTFDREFIGTFDTWTID